MEPDYPAGHSMDTCFFAIDREGRHPLSNAYAAPYGRVRRPAQPIHVVVWDPDDD